MHLVGNMGVAVILLDRVIVKLLLLFPLATFSFKSYRSRCAR